MKPFSETFSRAIAVRPGRILMLGYLLLIIGGTFLLMLPQATLAGHISLINAVFTAASAACVTGLTVVDTGTTFTPVGRTIILVLMQIGGLGIMVFSTLFLLSVGKKISLAGKLMIRDTYSIEEGRGVLFLLKEIVLFTGVIEIAGAGLLFFRFHRTQSLSDAVFNSIFHSVSAFCNAGFSLFANSFTTFQDDWIVSLTICFLIILGGIGFIVLSEIKNTFSFSGRTWALLSLHSKLVLTSTALLLITSTGLIVVLELQNTLSQMPAFQKLMVGFFQAVNARTAGFNSIPIGELTNGTLFIIVLLMFIGAAPGSCGGGIKITTFSSMLILGISRLKGQNYPHIFYRKISDASIAKAISVILVSITIIIVGIILLQQTEIGETSHQLTRGAFLELMFETMSAFGTVGLSTGVTPALTIKGKLIIAIMMFIGRLGPLAIAMSVSKRQAKRRYTYPRENIMIG
ncbi:MAG: ATPase [Desulfobacula sp.]|nr:ATPase [Desulfobacula sp.]